jgi:hypothetical protein
MRILIWRVAIRRSFWAMSYGGDPLASCSELSFTGMYVAVADIGRTWREDERFKGYR